MCVCMYIYIYVYWLSGGSGWLFVPLKYIYIHTYIYIYIYVHTYVCIWDIRGIGTRLWSHSRTWILKLKPHNLNSSTSALHPTPTSASSLLTSSVYFSIGAASSCNTLQHNATHCITLQHSAGLCNSLHHNAILQHTATHCNTLQHTATHCNTLQHTATYCITHCVISAFLSLSLSLSVPPQYPVGVGKRKVPRSSSPINNHVTQSRGLGHDWGDSRATDKPRHRDSFATPRNWRLDHMHWRLCAACQSCVESLSSGIPSSRVCAARAKG